MRLSPLLQAPTGQIFEAVRKLGLEGVVGKRIDSIYEPGERSGAWIKHRTNMEQEFVIGGYICRSEEILTRALPSVGDGVCVVETTWKGRRNGHLWSLVKSALETPEEQKGPLDWRAVFPLAK